MDQNKKIMYLSLALVLPVAYLIFAGKSALENRPVAGLAGLSDFERGFYGGGRRRRRRRR